MGIRFLCPNGHKLNVKSFLAGKRGICPHCGAKFEIPLESVASVPPPLVATTADAVTGQATASDQPVTGVANAPAVAMAAAVPGPQNAPSGSAAMGARPAAATAANPLAGPAEPNPVAPAPLLPDPIAESPGAVWYVRTSAGGQFGPARGDMLRQWLDERRIGPDYLVWREGWPEWKRASGVFARLAAPGPAGLASPSVPAPAVDAPRMDDDWVEAIIESQSHPSPVSRSRARSQPNNNLLLAISFVVVLLGAILVIVVIIAANKQMGSDDPPVDPPASSTSTRWSPRTRRVLTGTGNLRGIESGLSSLGNRLLHVAGVSS